MRKQNIQVFVKILCVDLIMAAILFLSAGTLDYWQAWVFLAIYFVSGVAITAYLMRHDPKLLERRMKGGPGAEKEKSQKIIMWFASVGFIALLVVPALDHRYAWSKVPILVVVVGDVMVALGYLIVFFVFKVNSFTSATIEHDAEQKVISAGPYARIRHPMYFGALIMMAGIPIALGSWWGLLVIPPLKLVIVWRLLDEEQFLVKNLPGYAEYRTKVRYRLVPHVW